MAANSSPRARFILWRTLHHPQLPAGESRPLLAVVFSGRGFFEGFLTARAVRGALARCGVGDGGGAGALATHGPGVAGGECGLRVASASLGTLGGWPGQGGHWRRAFCVRPQDSPPDRRSCPAERGPPYPLAHSLRTFSLPSVAGPLTLDRRRSARDRGRRAERFPARRRSHEAAHGGVYCPPAFLSMENVMPAKPTSGDRPNLLRREAGGRE